MFKVTLHFLPPGDDDIVKLHVMESPTKDGVFAEVDTTEEIGTYPNYISHYTTALANTEDDWFSIVWENAAGDVSDLLTPIKGGTETLLSRIVRRVIERDPAVSPNIAAQESEVVIYETLGSLDVPVEEVTPPQMSGMTYLTLARVYISDIVQTTQSESYTAGLVQQKTSSGQSAVASVDQLIELANKDLGLNVSVVMLMESVWPGTSVSAIENDQSRLTQVIFRQ
jgi:hypothetical protein